MKLDPKVFIPHNIQTLMYAYLRKLDKSLKCQAIVDKIDSNDSKYQDAYRDLVNCQIDCKDLDVKINKLILKLTPNEQI